MTPVKDRVPPLTQWYEKHKDKFNHRNALTVIIIAVLINAIKNFIFPLYIDEAYYWVWSKNLGLSYYDHPPMIAYLIRVFTLFADWRFLVRLPAVFCCIVSIWYIYKLAERVYNDRAAWLTIIIILLMPSIFLGTMLSTPDAPLIMFWNLAAWYTLVALEDGKWKHYILAGLCGGGMLLSKYTSVLFPAAAAVFMLIHMRRKFLDPRLWVALIIASVCFLPVIIWNFQHDWISFEFQYAHGTSATTQIVWADWFKFLGSVAGTFTPIFFIVLIIGTVRYRDWIKDEGRSYMICLYLVPLLFFIYKGLFKDMGLNWAAMIAMPGAAVIGATIAKYRLVKTFVTGAVFCLLLLILINFAWLIVPDEKNYLYSIYRPIEVAEHASGFLQPGDVPMADHYSQAAIFTYMAPGNPQAYIPTRTRFSMYDIWGKDADYSSMTGVYISKKPRPEELRDIFKGKVKFLGKYATTRKYKPKTYYIYRVGEAAATD